MALKLVVNNTVEEVLAEEAKKQKLLAERVVQVIKEAFRENPNIVISGLAINLFASLLVKKLGDDFPKDPKKRRELLNQALEILLNSLKSGNDC